MQFLINFNLAVTDASQDSILSEFPQINKHTTNKDLIAKTAPVLKIPSQQLKFNSHEKFKIQSFVSQ